jgi:hypothetical protein
MQLILQTHALCILRSVIKYCYIFYHRTKGLPEDGAIGAETCSRDKALFIIPTDTHNYKITGMLKQLKFRQLLRHVSVHAGTIIRELFRA